MSCAAALANLAIIEREKLVENAARMGERLHSTIEKQVGGLPIVAEVRSRGLMLAVELIDPQRPPQPLDKNLVSSLNMRAWKRGGIVVASGAVLRVAPPLSIKAAEADELAQIVGESLQELQDELTRSATKLSAASA